MTALDDKHKEDGVFIYTRKHPRYQTSIFARVEGQAQLQESRGNVSAGGFCYEATEELPPGTPVELLFRLPGAGVWLKGRGQVLGCMGGGDTVAVRGLFTSIDPPELQNVSKWIDGFIRLHQGELGQVEDPDEDIVFSTTIDC